MDGLVTALVDAAKKDLADAVEAGRLTEAQQTEILAGLEERITDLVNNGGPAPRQAPAGPAGRLRSGTTARTGSLGRHERLLRARSTPRPSRVREARRRSPRGGGPHPRAGGHTGPIGAVP